MEFKLSARQPFIFASVVRSHGWVQMEPFYLKEESGTLFYALRLDSGRLLETCMHEAEGGVSVETFLPQPDKDLSAYEQEDLGRKVRWMLELDQDLGAFYQLAEEEPKLLKMIQRVQGRVLRCPTFFEDVVKTILTTNTLWAATKRMNKNLVEQFGEALDGKGQVLQTWVPMTGRRAFPTPERLAQSDEATLRQQTRLGYRAPYILELARSVASLELDLEALKNSGLPTTELRKRLLAIKGVGGYAAANLLMILGRYDFIPVDSWACKMVSHEWYDQPVDKDQVEAAFEHWGQWKGQAYWFWDWKE